MQPHNKNQQESAGNSKDQVTRLPEVDSLTALPKPPTTGESVPNGPPAEQPKETIRSKIAAWFAKRRRIRIAVWTIIVFLVGLGPSIIAYSHSGDIGRAWEALKDLHVGDFLAFLTPMLMLLGILTFGSYRLFTSKEVPHEYVELLILGITIASYYAFGWPKEFTPAELKHKFSELCVILTLFLLAELAAALTFQAEKIRTSLQDATREAVRALDENTERSVQHLIRETAINSGHLDAVLLELLTTKKDLTVLLEAVNEVRDIDTRSHLIGQVIPYSRAWATFFESVRQESPVCLACCASLFDIYMDKEIQGITSPDSPIKHSLSIVTSDDLYLTTLRKMLDQISAVEGKDLFAWAITNVLPEYWYHWGQQYGQYGRNPLMDAFREDVAKQVGEGREYRRMFLVKWKELETLSVEKRERLNRLSSAKELYDMSEKVILLVCDKQGCDVDDAEFMDKPLHASLWSEILDHEEVLIEEKMAKDECYGIISTANLAKLPGDWEIDSVLKKKIGPGPGELLIKPRYLLEFWEEKYQSHNSRKDMSIFGISNVLDLQHLPDYTDLLLLGTKVGDNRTPIIAISADISQKSKTMLMNIFTAPPVLSELMELWKATEERTLSRHDFLSAYREMLSSVNTKSGGSPDDLTPET